MIFKKYNYSAENENIVIRKLNNKDFFFFKDWYKIDHVKAEVKDTISDKDIKSMISVEEKYYLILIIEKEKKPVGMIKIVELFFNSHNNFKLKAGALYSLIDKTKQEIQNNYKVNDFKIIAKENYGTELVESLNNFDDENHYDKLIMFIKNI